MTGIAIYFYDLREDIQKQILNVLHAKSPEELNWDADHPIAYIEVESL